MKKIVKILTLSVLAAALFVGCKPTETPTETPTNPDTNNGGSDTPVTTPADDENKDNTGADNEGAESAPAPTETVLFTLDFSGAELPENDYCIVTDTNNNNGNFSFTANDGISFNGGSWKEFAISPKNVSDLTGTTKIKVTYKTSGSVTFGDTDNDRFMVGVVCQGGEEVNWATTNLSWTAYYDASEDGATPTEYTTVTKNINWELKYKADGTPEAPLVTDFASIKAIRLYNQNMTSGKLHIKSISFIK